MLCSPWCNILTKFLLPLRQQTFSTACHKSIFPTRWEILTKQEANYYIDPIKHSHLQVILCGYVYQTCLADKLYGALWAPDDQLNLKFVLQSSCFKFLQLVFIIARRERKRTCWATRIESWRRIRQNYTDLLKLSNSKYSRYWNVDSISPGNWINLQLLVPTCGKTCLFVYIYYRKTKKLEIWHKSS